MKKYIIFALVALVGLTASAVKPSYFSTQQALLNAGDSVAIGDSGEVVIKYFNYTSTAVTNATVALVRIPAHSRIIGGVLLTTDMGGAEVMDLGLIGADGNAYINDTDSTADDLDLFLDGAADPIDTSWDTGGASAACSDGQYSYAAYDKDVYLALTNPSGSPVWVTAKAISGWVMYIK